jgi:hypothetical protein
MSLASVLLSTWCAVAVGFAYAANRAVATTKP